MQHPPVKGYFNVKQISELFAFICYGIGGTCFGSILNVDVALSDALQGKL